MFNFGAVDIGVMEQNLLHSTIFNLKEIKRRNCIFLRYSMTYRNAEVYCFSRLLKPIVELNVQCLSWSPRISMNEQNASMLPIPCKVHSWTLD